MIAIILAAGYATRMFPLTKDYPKGLLKIDGKEILEYILSDIEKISSLNKIYIVTNNKFYNIFNKWIEQRKNKVFTSVINDNTTSNDDRLGAIKDLQLVIEKEKIDEEILVLASDNLYDFSLKEFVLFFDRHKKTSIMHHVEENLDKLCRTGVATIEDNKVVGFIEKPAMPLSNNAVPPCYIFKKEHINLIKIFKKENMDSPGTLIQWLCGEIEIFSFLMPGKRIDIGNLEEYYKLNNK